MMNVKIYNKDKLYMFIINLDEDVNAITCESFVISNSDHMSLVSFIQNNPDVMIRLEDYGRVIIPPKKVSYLIKKYGLVSHNKYPMKSDNNYPYRTLLELVSLYMYDTVKYHYVEESKHIYDIETGDEIEFGSQRWDDIRNPNYYNIIKGIPVGKSLSLYFANRGYKRQVSPSGLLLDTSSLR